MPTETLSPSDNQKNAPYPSHSRVGTGRGLKRTSGTLVVFYFLIWYQLHRYIYLVKINLCPFLHVLIYCSSIKVFKKPPFQNDPLKDCWHLWLRTQNQFTFYFFRGILKPSTVHAEGGLWDPPPQGPCTRSRRCFPLPRPPDPCSSYQAEVGQRTGRSLGRGSQGSQVLQSQKRKQEIRWRETEEAVSSAGGGKVLSARRTQVEVSQQPRPSPGLYPAPPWPKLTSAFHPSAPPESSLLQEHQFPKQDVVLGEASEEVRANMGNCPGWSWWGQVTSLLGREG